MSLIAARVERVVREHLAIRDRTAPNLGDREELRGRGDPPHRHGGARRADGRGM